MKHLSQYLVKAFFVLSIFIIQINYSSALNVCPGQPATLAWSITGAYTGCPTANAGNPSNPFCEFTPSALGSKSVTLTNPGDSCTVNFQCQNGTKADGTPNYSNVGSATLGLHTGTALGANNCCTVGTNLANGTTVYVPTYGEWGNRVMGDSGGEAGGGAYREYWQTCLTQDATFAPQLGCYREEIWGSCTAPILPATGSVTGATCTIPTGASSCINTLT